MRVPRWRHRFVIGLVSAAGMTARLLAGAGPAAAAPSLAASVTAREGGQPSAAHSVRSALLAAYASYRHIPRGDVAGIRPGTLRMAGSPARTQWVMAGFLPARHDPARVLAGFQDGVSTAAFTETRGGRWRLVRAGGESLGCAGVLPSWVRRAWKLAAAGCASTPARPGHRRAGVRPATPDPGTIVSVANQNVGIGDTPASTDWGLDCDPYTTMVDVGVSTSGCGVDPHFNVQNENEEWCADFTKWVWEQGGVTADLGTLDPAAASFYTWGQQQGESMPTDPSDPAVGDAVVFYPAGSAPNGSYADHVGIVVAVNSDGTVNLVNGDFLGSSNITAQANDNVSLGSWSAAVWGSGEQWIFVSP
ncbi:MAG TPA: CHAP domain-containing protein [Streptosporangiaceae bacterium]